VPTAIFPFSSWNLYERYPEDLEIKKSEDAILILDLKN
jgi:hypothetical protein